MADTKVQNIFDNTLAPNPVTQFTLFRGVTDYTNLAQFDLYETGYSFLVLLQMPVFMDRLAAVSAEKGGYATLINNYRHIIEYEFRGAQGIEQITGETNALTNNITELNVITKVTEQGGSQFTMNYFERSGSIITKTHELFLRGVKDPKTQIKRYNGLLTEPLINRTNRDASGAGAGDGMQDKGYQYEVMHFLLIITDNTGLNVEKAYLLASCQPAAANTDIYNVTRGEIQFQEMGVQFNGIPLPGRIVTSKAVEFLAYINEHTCFDEMDFGYSALADIGTPEEVEAKNGFAESPTVESIQKETV